MNKTISLILLLFLCSSAFSQIEFGISLGTNSTNVESPTISQHSSDEIINLNFKDIEYGYHAGLYTRFKLFGVYVKPSFLLNSTKVNYSVNKIEGDKIISSIKSESFKKLDIPIELGFKLAFLRISAGPVAHIMLDSTSELFEIKEYSQKFKDATYGYWLGAGIDLWKLRLDFNYEGNLSRFADHLTINGQELEFSGKANRYLLTLGYAF